MGEEQTRASPTPAVRAVDYHTGGEPFRIVADLPFDIPGRTVAERRINAMNSADVDGLRKLLCFEPRGHADMYGGFIVEADDTGADFGVLFWHKDGFSTACGHGTIALGAWAIATGVVAPHDSGMTDVVIDVPSGRVTARVSHDGNRVRSVEFINVPSYVLGEAEVATTRGSVSAAVSFGGAIYAQVRASDLGLRVVAEDLSQLIAVGREIKWALNDHAVAKHPSDDRLSGVYGTILFDELRLTDAGHVHQRNVTIFADGEVDRSPCGSGTSARLATLVAGGRLPEGRELIHDSIVGSTFVGRVLQRCRAEGRDAVLTSVSGTAFLTGEHTFTVDPDDWLVPGFVLR